MNIDPQIQNPLEHDDSCPVWDDIQERIKKAVGYQKLIRECASYIADKYLDESDIIQIEEMVFSHVEDAGDDTSSIVNELHAEYLNLRS